MSWHLTCRTSRTMAQTAYEALGGCVCPPQATLTHGCAMHQEGNMLTYQLTGMVQPAGVLSVPREHFIEWFRFETEYKAIMLDRMSREQNRMVRVRSVRDMTVCVRPLVLVCCTQLSRCMLINSRPSSSLQSLRSGPWHAPLVSPSVEVVQGGHYRYAAGVPRAAALGVHCEHTVGIHGCIQNRSCPAATMKLCA